MGKRHTIEAEVFSLGAAQRVKQPAPPRGPTDWRLFAAGALILGLALGWLLGSSGDITRQAEVAKPLEIAAPETLGGSTVAGVRSAVVPTTDISLLDRRVVLSAGGGLIPLHSPSPQTGSASVWTFEEGKAVAVSWDDRTPFGFSEGSLLAIGESAITAYDSDLQGGNPAHVLALQSDNAIVRTTSGEGLWIRRQDDSLRYFDFSRKRYLSTYIQSPDVPHLHGMTPLMLLWQDENDPEALPYDLATLADDGEVIPIDLTGREDLPLRGYSGTAVVFGGISTETELYLSEDQSWLTIEYSASAEGLTLNAVVSPDRRYAVIIFGGDSSEDVGDGVKAIVLDVETGETLLGFVLHNPAAMPLEWIDDSTLLWIEMQRPGDQQLEMANFATGEQVVLANMSGIDWRLFVEPES